MFCKCDCTSECIKIVVFMFDVYSNKERRKIGKIKKYTSVCFVFLLLDKLMSGNSIPILVNVCEIDKLNERWRIVESPNG